MTGGSVTTPEAARKGDALIELLIVIGIVGVTAAIALPPYRKAYRRAQTAGRGQLPAARPAQDDSPHGDAVRES